MDRIEALWRRCRAGDAEALEELIRRWERKLFYYVRRLVAEEADAWDVLQQTWLRVIKGIGAVRDADKLVPWLYCVARSAALSHRKSLLARERFLDRQASIDELGAAPIREIGWSAQVVHDGMQRLSIHHRETLTLFFLEDLLISQIAQVLAVSEGTVKSRLFYAKQALREVLEQSGSHP